MNIRLVFSAMALSIVALDAPASTESCQTISEQEVAALFEGWNAALRTGDPTAVNALYRADAVLLPTLSPIPRLTSEGRIDYFKNFLASKPVGAIDSRTIKIGCNTATDIGLYTFTFVDGRKARARFTYTYQWDGKQWLISTHHSSLLPEGAAAH